ncbi:leucine-rich repeat-containing protein 72-like isoform X1 [Diadema setosum]|uniref:leucine-rich repeat-containing protein 72-like isoform X1 n=2 Tax=Diadema setosum TaxID=31175 RepID=UPI003B3AD783
MAASSTTSVKLIEDQMSQQGIRKDLDVTELYLSNQGLTEVSDLSQYKLLNRLWLNGNKLRRINCLSINYRLTELYLQDNELVSVCGLLAPLTNLRVLMLHNNQLTKLEETVTELRALQALHTLNLSQNPLAQETEYRHYVIFHTPPLQLLDRQEVLKSEREEAAKLYQQDRQALLETIAFGRRCPGPVLPSQDEGVAMETRASNLTMASDREVANNFFSPPREKSEEAVAERAVKRSIMEFSHFDWSKAPRAEERRMNKGLESNRKTEIVTVKFR